jgi:3-isopropylmalate dehydratase small subunit
LCFVVFENCTIFWEAYNIKSQFVEVTELSLKINFEIPPLKKQCIMEGLDETQYLIRLKDKITEFELTNY